MKPHVVILGAGPAGLGAAYQLTRLGLARATVLEAKDVVGGNAGSFELAGLPVDYGSHRLHPSCSPEVLRDIRALLGDDLLDRPRHGRIRLRGRWIHFPLKPVDLALRLPPSFALGAAAELPCSPDGAEWDMSDEDLGTLVCRALETAGIPFRAPVEQVVTRRLRHAYPIYQRGYEAHFGQLDWWIDRTKCLLTFGRQGLFAHDNTHHALHMAYCAVDCLDGNGGFDKERWHSFRRVFETHVVED